MTARAQRHDPRLDPAVRASGKGVMQPGGEGEVPDVVGRELELAAAVGQLTRWQRHHSGVVDEQMQRPVPGGDERVHGVEVGEVESADPDGLVAGRAADIDSGPLDGGVSRTASITSAPVAASARAVSMPIPDEAPVTIARRPERSTLSVTSQIVDSAPKPV